MRSFFSNAGCFLFISLQLMFAQGPTLSGTGYLNPSIIRVAPGQITTLLVTGLKTVLQSQPVKGTSLPLPTSLLGISVLLSQNGQRATAIPLLSIQQVSMCNSSLPDCLVTALTVQFPYEMMLPPQATVSQVAVNENAMVSQAFTVMPVSSNLHILNGCDAFPQGYPNFCSGVVTHADGSPVRNDSPAKAGEIVVIYAYGLGQTAPTGLTGNAATAAASLANTAVHIQFDFRPNAVPSNPYVAPNGIPIPPIYVGLTPGEIGLYQINVKLPEVLPAVAPCSITDGVISNLTIDVGSTTSGGLSFDGAPICVQSPQ